MAPVEREEPRDSGPVAMAATGPRRAAPAPGRVVRSRHREALPAAALALAALLTVPPPARAADGATLFRVRSCESCHQVDTRRVGPPLRAIAQRYANDPAAAERLARKIRAGGGGVWGAVPMPEMRHVSPEEATVLARWVLAQR